jgi:uncharacterized protein (TIRG00374 family)
VIPTVVGFALIAALLGVSDAGKVGVAMSRLKPEYALAFVVLMVVYEAIRGLQWHVLLKALGIRAPLAAEAFSFLLGEATKSAPIGNYFQNYLLARAESEDFGRTSATTTLVVLTEVALSLLTVLVIGIDGWTWLRPLIGFGLLAFLCLVLMAAHWYRGITLPEWLTQYEWERTVIAEWDRFRTGVVDLINLRTLLVETVLGAAYLATAGVAFYLAAIGLGITGVVFPQLFAIYAFSLAAGLILPLPIDLGVFEVSGVGALVASGVSKDVALSLMLVNRLLSVGSALLIGGVAMLVLRDELKAVLRQGNSAAQVG